MIKDFIATVVAILFAGRATSGIRKKTHNASKTRTFIYFLLSVVLLVCTIKTHQITTIYNSIQVDPLYASFDSLGNCIDTIPNIELFSSFNANGNYDNPFIINKNKEDADFKAKGGIIRFSINAHNDVDSFPIIKNPKYKKFDLKDEFIPPIDFDHLYLVVNSFTSPPSVVPLFPNVNLTEDWMLIEDSCMRKSSVKNIRDEKNLYFGDINDAEITIPNKLKKVFNRGLVAKCIYATHNVKNAKEPITKFDFSFSTPIANSMNLFTAADISQYTYQININTDCPILNLTAYFDTPIEIVASDIEIDSKNVSGFRMKGNEIKRYMKETGDYITVHIELPTMENLQTMRSLFLTTVLSAIVSLFFSNFYFLMRKHINHRKFLLPYSKAKKLDQKRVRKFIKNARRASLVFVAFVILVPTYYICKEDTWLIPIKLSDYFEYFLLVALVFVILIAMYIHNHAASIVLTKKRKKEIKKEREKDVAKKRK